MTMRTQGRISAADVGDLGSDLLERLAETIGEDEALRLSMRFGGQQLYIPVNPPPDSNLVQTIGHDAARRLARRHGGIFVQVPRRAGEHARIILLRKAGKRVREITAIVGCTERHVYEVLKQYRRRGGRLPAPKPTRQGRTERRAQPHQRDLFEEET